ncbi:uncharacterized protein FOBCDRAFT_281095 [Fusarium oxysporum Fo47]|nr:uncharacterized protein FOBCDRAFT_281095 [Fusarium oxysporum Fo47]QKD61462.2 hypothetical protein FOBCDRAFT_281095 [Fusarium oxysporum Fo47]
MAPKQPNDNPVTLNQPCKFCKVLEFDDSSFGGESKTSDDGTPFVDFGKVKQTKEDREAQIGARIQRARMALSFAMQNADADAPEKQTRDYSIHDTIYADRADHCSSWFDMGRRPIMNDQLSKASLSRVKELVVLSEKEQPYKLVCRALGIRYLWVDALCIIQGDAGDWSQESFQMSKIYENSYLTLCIVQGDSCSSGFLKKDYTPPNLKINYESKLNSAISGHLTLRMLLPPSETVRRCTPEDCKYGRADGSPGDTDLQNAAC